MNIIDTTVSLNRCIGCGVCAGVCPAKCLEMDWADSGAYEPKYESGCIEKCDICIKACPFVEQNGENLDISNEIFSQNPNFDENLGHYNACYEVHKIDDNERLASASGGAGDFILSELLGRNLVDFVIAVEPNDDENKLFKFSVFSTPDELKSARGSAYYPVEFSDMLRFLLKNDARYAITALPCLAKALRLASKKNKKLQKRIKFIISLVCGGAKTKTMTAFMGQNLTGSSRIKSVNFRKKDSSTHALNFKYEFCASNGKIASANLGSPNGAGKLWQNRFFTPLACNECSDTYGLCGDAVLMDAWLDRYISDYKGHSLVVTRNQIIDEILSSEKISTTKIDKSLVLKAQAGVVSKKRLFRYGTKNPILSQIRKNKIAIQKLSLDKNWEQNLEKIARIIAKNNKLSKFATPLATAKILPSVIYRKILNRIKK